MNRIIKLIIPILISFLFLGGVLHFKYSIKRLEAKIDELSYNFERESILKEKYYNMLKFQVEQQYSEIKQDIILNDQERNTFFSLSNILEKDDLVLCIPENSCTDCIENIFQSIKENSKFKSQRIIVLSVFYDKNEQIGFRKTYNILNNKWLVFNINSKYFWNISGNKILFLKADNGQKFRKFIILDGEFDELLTIFLNHNL